MLDAAIVGLGWWGKRIVGAVQGRSEALRFVHGVSQEPDEVREFAAAHGLALSSGIDSVLRDQRVRAVVLATPHSQHADQIVQAAAAGKHVLCEKPLALALADAERAVEACRRAGVLLGIGTNRRYVPPMQALRKLVADGALGRLLHVEGNFTNANSNATYAAWRTSEHESPAGPMTAAGIHMLDALVSLCGPVARVDAHLVVYRPAPNPLDALSVVMRHAGGVSATFAAVRASPMFWRIHAFGTDASAEALGEAELVVHGADGAAQRTTFDRIDSVRASVEAFAAAALGRADYPVPPSVMLDVVAAFEAIVRSAGTGSAVEVQRVR